MSTKKLIIFTDGSAVPNPGKAGFGVVIQDGDGNPVTTIARSIGHGTNNQAEYQGIITALEKAVSLGAESVDMRSDSELVVRQMTGRYRVKSPLLKPLYTRAKELQAKIKNFSIRHIPRELNREADRLAETSLE